MNLNFIEKIKSIERNTIFGLIAVVAIIIVAFLVSADQGGGFSLQGVLGMSNQQVGEKVINYINDNQLSQTPASLVGVAEESGMVKVSIAIGDQQFDSYATKDGKILFPQRGLDMEPQAEDSSVNSDGSDQTPAPVTKTDSPMLEAFVVSRCPYGLQMQRAIADAVKSMPALAKYIKVEYMGSVSGNSITSMHGDAEAVENLRQICIRDEQPTKYWDYVACQMQAGDTAGCQTSTGVDSAKLNACVSDPGRGVTYAQKDFALNATYNVTGSPTLILNGTQISESNFGGRSSDGVKSMVCAGFNADPSFCSTTLNTAPAAPSFSTAYSASTASGSDNVTCE